MSWSVLTDLRDLVLGLRGSGNGFGREGPVGILRKTSNRGPAEGRIELRRLVFGPVFFMCLLSFRGNSFSLDFVLLIDICNLNNLLSVYEIPPCGCPVFLCCFL